MVATLRKSLKTIEDYKSASPHYTELLDIMADILILRKEYRNSMKDSIFSVDIIKSQQFDWEKMVRTSFERKVEETNPQGFPAAREAEESIDLIDLFAEESLRPELEIIAEKYGETVEKSKWSEGYCPICGKEPKIGEIRKDEDGKRYLFCHQCGFKWNFNRIKCPFCGNEEQHSLAYFEVEGEERYRVDVCNKCRRYIKTVELPKSSEEPDLDIEDIATLHLDMIAYDEGYN